MIYFWNIYEQIVKKKKKNLTGINLYLKVRCRDAFYLVAIPTILVERAIRALFRIFVKGGLKR